MTTPPETRPETPPETSGTSKPDWGAAAAGLGLMAVLVAIAALLPLPLWGRIAAGVWLLLCLIAWLGTLDAASRTHIARSLRDSRFTQLYRFTVNRQLKLLWKRYCDPIDDAAGPMATVQAALTHRLYSGALAIAVFYPVVLFVGWWLLGFEGRLGGQTVLPVAPLWPDRVVGFIILIIGCVPFYLALLGGWKGRLNGAFAATTALLIVVGSVVFASLSTVLALILTAILVVPWSAAIYFEGRAPRITRAAITLAIPSVWMAAVGLLSWDDVPTLNAALFLFLAVLPLLNAVVDFVSYAVTLTLIRRGLQAKQPLLYGALDLAIALVLFLVLGALMTAVIAGLNALAGGKLLDLADLFAGVALDPHAYWWLYAMLFSTLVPTALHGLLSLLGAQALAPLTLRRPAARLLEDAGGRAWAGIAAPLAVGAVWALPVFAAGAIVYGLWWIGADALALVAGLYLDALTGFAAWIGAIS